MTDVDRDEEIERLFYGVLDLPEADRDAWLEGQAPATPEVLAEVRSLLRAYAAAPGLLDPAMLRDRTDAAPGPEALAGRVLGPWRILKLLATGGMGAVYLGERIDDAFRMRVAVKILTTGSFHPGLLSRFRIERQVLADLDHPGIARLLDGGTTAEGTPYLVMEYVEGAPLLEFARTRELSIEARLRLFLEVAAAVQYAHSRLVIHRDLKPGNILVRDDGHPKLLDFGIAKVFQSESAAGGAETVAATAWAMTPRYASPEQIRGERVTTASDIYSLGVVLHELLTGRLPYTVTGDSLIDLGRAICEAPLVPPSRIPGLAGARRLAGDLDTILLKALAKDPDRRYASVAGFAGDVRRHLDGEPVLARGDSAGYRLRQFARRHRGLVAGLASFVAVLVAALAITLAFSRRSEENAEAARWSAYAGALAAAEAAIMNHSVREAEELLAMIPAGYDGWEHRHLRARLDRSRRAFRAHAAGITQLRFSPDGSRFLTTGVDRAVRVWDTATGDSLAGWRVDAEVESGDFAARGHLVVFGLTDGRVLLAAPGSVTVDSLGRGSNFAILDAHPDGDQVAAGFENGEVALFDVASRTEVRRWKAHYRLAVPAWSPDGALLATAGSDSLVRIWELPSGRLRATLAGHRHRIFGLAFSPDGRQVASASRDRTATVWDLETGAVVTSFSEHRGTPSPLVFLPDGRRILSAGTEGRVLCWDARTGARLSEFHGHRADVAALDVTPDGRLVATGEWDGTVRYWSPNTDDIRILALPDVSDMRPVTDLDIDPTGTLLVALSNHDYALARRVVLRDLEGGWVRQLESVYPASVACVDSTLLLVGTDHGLIELRNGVFEWAHGVTAHRGRVGCLLDLGDGRRLVSGGDDGQLRLWALPGLDSLASVAAHSSAIVSVATDGAGRHVASAAADGTIRLWDLESGRPPALLPAEAAGAHRLALDPAGRRLAYTTASGAACLWSMEAGASPDTLLNPGSGALSIAFSPDGARIVVGSHNSMLYILDVDRRATLLRLHGHLSRVGVVRFTPDGRRLLSGSQDGTIRVWDTAP